MNDSVNRQSLRAFYLWVLIKAKEADMNTDTTSAAAFFRTADEMETRWPYLKNYK